MKGITRMVLIGLIEGFVITYAVYGLWVSLEIAYYGEIQPREVDNIIGLLLMLSLLANYRQWKRR